MVAVTPTRGGVMSELNSQIASLEMRCEQLITHLRTGNRHTEAARVRRADLYALLKEMGRLKRKREQLGSLGLPHAA
jgi:hypothetical protein